MCSRNSITSFTEYNKDKVPMDIATSLVVNHVNIGALCLFVLCLCLCLWRSYRSKIIHKHLKDWITVGILCMNAKLLLLSSVRSKLVADYKQICVKILVVRLLRSRSIQ